MAPETSKPGIRINSRTKVRTRAHVSISSKKCSLGASVARIRGILELSGHHNLN